MPHNKRPPSPAEPASRLNEAVAANRRGLDWEVQEAILQGNPVATFVIDAAHHVTHWNRACELITGLPANQVIGTCEQWKGFYPAPRPTLADLICAREIDQALERYEEGKCHRSEIIDGAYEAEAYFPHAGGNGRWLYFTAAPVHDAAGAIVGAIETLQDITARKVAEQALQEQFENLETLVAQRTAELSQRNAELIELTEQRSQLEERVSYASSTAMTAMSSMGEMGVLLQALQHYNGCKDFAEIADAMIASLASYDLAGVVQVRTPGRNFEVATDGKLSSHDTAVFAGLRDMGRIVHFHSRMIINYDTVSLLIHNIPKDDTEKTGRIRDNLAILVEAADVRVVSLLAENGTVSRQHAILATVEKIGGVLSSLECKQNDSLAASSMAMHNMSESLEKLFVHLGLTPRQEDMLLELVNSSLEQMATAQAGQLDFQRELSEIIGTLAAFSR